MYGALFVLLHLTLLVIVWVFSARHKLVELCILHCRSEGIQVLLQSFDICDSIQQSHTNQPAGHAGACQIHAGNFHQLGRCCIAEFFVFV